MPQSVEVAKQKGARVLLVAHHPDFETFQDDLKNAIPMAAIVILDPLRADAKETIDFFRENDVLIKVISGDDCECVGSSSWCRKFKPLSGCNNITNR